MPKVPIVEVYSSAMRHMIAVRIIIRLIAQPAPASVRINEVVD